MIKVGILGVGYLGKIHIKQLKEIKQIEISGFYDPDHSLTENITKEFGIRKFNDEPTLIDASDAIIIAASTTAHYELSKKCIIANKHVFIEKPVCETIEQANELLHLAQQKTICIQVGHIERFNPAYLASKKWALSPAFIQSERLGDYNFRASQVSVVLDLLIHDIDLILKIVPHKINKITASGATVLSNFTDIANATLEFENGTFANLTASRISSEKKRIMKLYQPSSYVSIDFLNNKTEKIQLDRSGNAANLPSFLIDVNNEKRTIIKENQPVIPHNALKEELQSFFLSISHGTPPLVSLNEAYHALKVASEIMKQIELNALYKSI